MRADGRPARDPGAQLRGVAAAARVGADARRGAGGDRRRANREACDVRGSINAQRAVVRGRLDESVRGEVGELGYLGDVAGGNNCFWHLELFYLTLYMSFFICKKNKCKIDFLGNIKHAYKSTTIILSHFFL